MAKQLRHLFLLIVLSFLSVTFVMSWGFHAHKIANQYAVFTLPEQLIGFYKKNIDYLTEHSIDADKRRYAIKEEAPRHYIDIDYYGDDPFDIMPKRWGDAIDKFSVDTLFAYGILPWHIEIVYNRLVRAFKHREIDYILKYSADLGHYIADAHVPLHTTINYDGQLTNQKGIHAFWESRLPELFAEDYDYLVGSAEYRPSVLNVAWKTIEESYNCLDSVLGFEKNVSENFPRDRQYTYEKKGMRTIKQKSAGFSEAYHVMLDGMVERRLQLSISTIGDLWYSAWIDGGRPVLDGMMDSETPFVEEIKRDHKITVEDARGHQN